MQRKSKTKNSVRQNRHARIRSRISGTAERPRLAVFRSNRFIAAQLIDDGAGKTVAAAHGREFSGSQSAQAQAVGESIAKKAAAKGISSAVFDRGGYRYAGQVKALADAARAGGLAF